MSSKYTPLTDALHAYLVAHGSPRDPILAELAEETARLGGISSMQIAPEQGTFMTMLARLMGARNALEIGTFTGYSALCVARGLTADGHLLCCDVNEEWTSIARRYWARAGVDHKIELRLGPALQTLASLPSDTVFDMAFIDADKGSYPAYYEEALRRLRPGGLLVIDNVLWSGHVADPTQTDDNTTALRHINDLVAADRRVDAVMLPIADGLTLARKH